MTASDIITAIRGLDASGKAAVLVALVADIAQSRPAPVADTSARPTLVDVNTLASALDLPKSHLMTLARQKKIPSIHIGKYVRFKVAEVENALRATPANVDNCKHSR